MIIFIGQLKNVGQLIKAEYYAGGRIIFICPNIQHKYTDSTINYITTSRSEYVRCRVKPKQPELTSVTCDPKYHCKVSFIG